MKKNLMSVAVAATLVGASSAHAVFVNPDGSGQALIFPYFTVEGGQDTYINLVNTTNQVKAVKVRFLEGMNSQEVLDFNLYMSPQDHWSAVVFDNGEGASIRTADTTCTVPNSLSADVEGTPGPDVAFRSFTFDDDSVNGDARTREGYVEVIEMGVLSDPDDIIDATHANGVPVDCSTFAGHFQGGGKWAADESADVDTPTGGLYGYGVLINVQEGTNATYDALALDQFANTTDIHSSPGSLLPGIASADPVATVTDASSASVIIAPTANGQDAVSAVLMHAAIQNDYVLEQSIAASTDWVVTFPTKKSYVNGIDAPIAPFTNAWDPETSQACEEMGITLFDREERTIQPDPLDFSPQPEAPGFNLCKETNIISFNDSNVLAASDRVGHTLNVDFQNGWGSLDFTAQPGMDAGDRELSTDAGVFFGLPVVGFAVQKYVNGELEDGTKSNYAGVVDHRSTRVFSGT